MIVGISHLICIHSFFISLLKDTYRSGNHESGEQVPEAKEERHKNGSDLLVWSESHKHHSIEGEVHKAHQHEKIEPQELGNFPVEPDHRVKQQRVHYGLD